MEAKNTQAPVDAANQTTAQAEAEKKQAELNKLVVEKIKALETNAEYKDVVAYIRKVEMEHVQLANQVAQFTQAFLTLTMTGSKYIEAINQGQAQARAAAEQALKAKEVASAATAHAAAAKNEIKATPGAVEALSKNVPTKEETPKVEA